MFCFFFFFASASSVLFSRLCRLNLARTSSLYLYWPHLSKFCCLRSCCGDPPVDLGEPLLYCPPRGVGGLAKCLPCLFMDAVARPPQHPLFAEAACTFFSGLGDPVFDRLLLLLPKFQRTEVGLPQVLHIWEVLVPLEAPGLGFRVSGAGAGAAVIGVWGVSDTKAFLGPGGLDEPTHKKKKKHLLNIKCINTSVYMCV